MTSYHISEFYGSKLFSPEDAVFFDPSSTGHGPGKLATVPYLFRKHYQKFQPSLMYPGVGSHVDSDKEVAWQ